MWLNTIRVRRPAQRCFGNCLADSMYGIDEKPIHLSEACSGSIGTLEIQGASAVKLKHNHAASRERVSIMTCVTSNRALATSAKRPPMEVLFKAKSARRTAALTKMLPSNTNVSVQWAEKGSYRKAEIIEFLGRWLDPWSEARAKSHDYRIMYSDVARSHMGEDVVDFAWSRGYLFLFHYGGTTGVAQVNDTDCHQAFESTNLEFEHDAFNQRQLIDPGNINRSPRDVLDDAVATWRTINHEQGVEGFKRTGASIALDGSEDGRLCREALECWDEIGMPALRDEALAEVDEAFESKGLTFKDWRSLIKNPDDVGVMEEGEEFEGELESGEPQWVADGEEGL